VGQRRTASSTVFFSSTTLPFMKPPSAVMTTFDSESSMRPCRASWLNPPYTTEWTAPIFADASMAITISGMRGM
jgi:hypothetical protein